MTGPEARETQRVQCCIQTYRQGFSNGTEDGCMDLLEGRRVLLRRERRNPVVAARILKRRGTKVLDTRIRAHRNSLRDSWDAGGPAKK